MKPILVGEEKKKREEKVKLEEWYELHKNAITINFNC